MATGLAVVAVPMNTRMFHAALAARCSCKPDEPQSMLWIVGPYQAWTWDPLRLLPEIGAPFSGVLIVRALLFGVCIWAPDIWKLPYIERFYCRPEERPFWDTDPFGLPEMLTVAQMNQACLSHRGRRRRAHGADPFAASTQVACLAIPEGPRSQVRNTWPQG